MKLNISYCGGCNPLYERSVLAKKFVARLKECYPGPVEVVYGRDKAADVGVVIAGCTVCCPDREEIPLPVAREFLVGPGLLNYQSIPEAELIERLVQEVTDCLQSQGKTGIDIKAQGFRAEANRTENQVNAQAEQVR